MKSRLQPLRSLLRRVCALIALFGVLVASVERFLPDVHDGDVVATQAVDAGIEHCAPAVPGAPSDKSPNVPHADHCAHAHGFAVDRATFQAQPVAAVTDPLDTTADLPASVSMRPYQRPPIA